CGQREIEQSEKSGVKPSSETQRAGRRRQCRECNHSAHERRKCRVSCDVSKNEECRKNERALFSRQRLFRHEQEYKCSDECEYAPRLVPGINGARDVPSPHFPEGDQLKTNNQQKPLHTVHPLPPFGRYFRYARKIRNAPATTMSTMTSGSGIVGTVPGLTGVRSDCAYCCAVSRTTAPLTGVTS